MEENNNILQNNEEIKKTQEQQVKKIIPSYKKQNDNKKTIKKGPKSKITIIILIIICIAILLGIILGIYKLVEYNTNKKYDVYKEEMSVLGFDRMFDNKNNISSEKVKKSEAVKLAISSALNIYDISTLYELPNQEYENEAWVKYAEQFNIIVKDSINKDNQDDSISVIDFLSILSNVKLKTLGMEIDAENALNINYEFFKHYSNEQQIVLKDMIYNKILNDVNESSNYKKNLTKGYCSEILLNFVKKYNTITVNGSKLNINDEKLPENVKDYPYILANIDKSVYQKKYKYVNVGKFKTSAQVYADIKEMYPRIDYLVSEYMDTILNVDYNTINQEEFENKLKNILGNYYNKISIDNYVKYVKDNHISVRGSAQVQYPIIYFDGLNYRVRVKANYTIDSADYLKQIFYLDKSDDVNYKIGLEDIYLDVILYQDSKGVLYVLPTSILDLKLS